MIDQMVSYNRNTGPSMGFRSWRFQRTLQSPGSNVQSPWYLPLRSRPCTMGMALDSTRKTVNRSGGRE